MKKGLIFDMDGTIFDTERLGFKGWQHAFAYFDYDVPIEILKKKIELNSKDSKNLIQQYMGSDFDYTSIKEEKRNFVRNYIDINGTPIKSGIISVLDLLDLLGIKKSIATSRGHTMANYYIDKSNLRDRFDLIVTGDMVNKGKPNPDIFLKTSEILNVSNDKCLVIEDSPNGIEAGKRACMTTIMVPDLIKPNSILMKKVDYLFDSLNDLL